MSAVGELGRGFYPAPLGETGSQPPGEDGVVSVALELSRGWRRTRGAKSEDFQVPCEVLLEVLPWGSVVCFFLTSQAILWRFDRALVLGGVFGAYLVVTSVFCDSMLKVSVRVEDAPQPRCVSKGKGMAENSGSMSCLQ